MRALRGHILHHVRIEAVAEEEIDESGAGDFTPVEIGSAEPDMLYERLRNLARGRMERFGGSQRKIGGVIAVGMVCRNFNRNRFGRFSRKLARLAGFLRRAEQGFL